MMQPAFEQQNPPAKSSDPAQKPVYLDYNASAPLLPEAKAAMAEALDIFGNASSPHGAGRRIRHHIETARCQIAALVTPEAPVNSAHPSSTEVILTSGASEANNFILQSFSHRPILIAENAHESLRWAIDGDHKLSNARPLPVDQDGCIRLDHLQEILSSLRGNSSGALVALTLVHNETGVIENLQALGDIAKTHGAFLHIDAVQAAGRIDLTDLPATPLSLVLSAHKMGGAAGIGALILQHPEKSAKSAALHALVPLIKGGGQEQRWRAGTENFLGAISFGAAAQVALQKGLSDQPRLRLLRDKLQSGLCAVNKDLTIVAGDRPRVANTLNVISPGESGERLMIKMDLQGIMVSTGSACSSGKTTPSAALLAQGYAPDQAASALRFSLGYTTTEEDITRCIDAYAKAIGTKATGAKIT